VEHPWYCRSTSIGAFIADFFSLSPSGGRPFEQAGGVRNETGWEMDVVRLESRVQNPIEPAHQLALLFPVETVSKNVAEGDLDHETFACFRSEAAAKEKINVFESLVDVRRYVGTQLLR
jgi:hypothetical protein